MSELINFGSIFSFDEKEFVFLAKTESIIYTAQILDRTLSSDIKKQCEKTVKKGNEGHKLKLILYCYVELRTEDYKGRIAYYGKTDREEVPYFLNNVTTCLDKEDASELHKELMEDESFVSQELKELIENIKI